MEIYYFVLVAVFFVHIILSNEVGVTARKKGLKFFPVFIFSMFATPIGGLLYAILLLHNTKQDENLNI